MKLYIPILILFAIFRASAEPVAAGRIEGFVIDAKTGEALAGANVVVLGTTLGAASNIDGEFVIEKVPVGIYGVRALVIGYEQLTETDVMVMPVKPAKLRFELKASVVEFDELTVKPSYFVENNDKPISTQMQTSEEIRRLPGGFEDVVRAISVLPGVAQAEPGRNDLIVRGGAPSENLYIVDGIEIPNINHFGTQGAAGGPLSYINLDFVKNTTFSAGGFGARFGDKLSSVLTINLREGRDDRLGGKATISATQFGLNIEGPINEKGSFLFSARRSYLDFIFKASGFGFVPEYWDFMGKANYKLSKNDYLSILAIGALDQTKFFNDSRKNILKNSQILGNSQNQGAGGISWKHLFGSGFSTITFGQSFVDFNFVQTDTTLNPIFKNNSLEHESTLTTNLVLFPSEEGELTVGAQGKVVRFSSDMMLPPTVDAFGSFITTSRFIDTTATKYAAWTNYSHTFGRLSTNAGVRLDGFSMIKQKAVLAPRLSLKYSVSPLTDISASFGKYYQSPSYIWIAGNAQNNSLEYIAADQVVLGISRLLREDTKVSVEGYIKKYSDYPASVTRPYLVMANTGAGFGGADDGFSSFGFEPLVSEGTGSARGIELFAQKKLSTSPLYGTVSISYNQVRFTALDGVSRPGSYEQKWILNVGGGYMFNESWEVSGKFRLATGRPYTPFNPDFSKSYDLYNTSRTPANHFLDIRVDRRWYFSSVVFITYVDIQNVYNRAFRNVPRLDVYEGRIEQSRGIGILPSIGLSAEF